jgi:hypothetical protein
MMSTGGCVRSDQHHPSFSVVKTARPTMFDHPPMSDMDSAVRTARPTALTTPIIFSESLGSVVRTARPIMFITTSPLPIFAQDNSVVRTVSLMSYVINILFSLT